MASLVVVVGSFNVDHVWSVEALPVPGETRSGRYASGPGGKGFNQAVASVRAGAATRFVCALGADAGGQLARALAVAEGLDLRDAEVDAPTGAAAILVDAQGRNSIVVAAGANGSLDAAHVAHEFESAAPPAVVLVQLETPVDAASVALSAGRQAGAITLLNPAPADGRPTRALLDLADILTPNETEFATLVEQHLGSSVDPASVASLTDDALHSLCRALLPAGTVVITLGAAGCFVSHPDGMRRGDTRDRTRVAAVEVSAIDTTGAGDAFNGALAASLATTAATFCEHVQFAGRYASLSTEHPGAALSMPGRAYVMERFPS